MARPSKFNQNIVDQLIKYISDGLTIRDACYGVGISEDTFWRWRRQRTDFAEAIQTATPQHQWSSEALARTSSYRRYNRNVQNSHKSAINRARRIGTRLDAQSGLREPLKTLKSDFNNAIPPCLSMMTRTKPPRNLFGDLVSCGPYYNAMTDRIEWVENKLYGRCVLHASSPDKWLGC